jgi:hypothetical protein
LDNLDACPGNLLASFTGQRQQNPKRFLAEWQMKSQSHRSQLLRLARRSTLERIADRRHDPHVCAAKNHAAPGRDRECWISGMVDSVVKPQLDDIKPKVLPRVPHPFSAFGPIFLQTCTLY